MAKQIAEISKRDLREMLENVDWWGRLEETEFLGRLVVLPKMWTFGGGIFLALCGGTARRVGMRKSRFTETQIVAILKEADAGRPGTEARRWRLQVLGARFWVLLVLDP